MSRPSRLSERTEEQLYKLLSLCKYRTQHGQEQQNETRVLAVLATSIIRSQVSQSMPTSA